MIDISLTQPTQHSAPRRAILTHDKDDDYVLRIDNSSLEKFQTCPRSAKHYLVSRREKQPSTALAFGSAVHIALENLYKTGFTALDISSATQLALAEYHAKFNSQYPDFRTAEYLVKVINSYSSHYCPTGASDLNIHSHNSTPAVEIPFALQLFDLELDAETQFPRWMLVDKVKPEDSGGMEKLYIKRLYVLWSGKIDLVAAMPDSLAVCDHKTSSVGGVTFFNSFRLSQPVIGYLWACSKILGQDVRRFLLNAIFLRRTGKVDFERRFYFYEENQFNDWEKDIKCEVSNFVGSLIHGHFPKAPVWCTGKFGMCSYHDVCCAGSEEEQDMLLASSLFTNVSWSPLND